VKAPQKLHKIRKLDNSASFHPQTLVLPETFCPLIFEKGVYYNKKSAMQYKWEYQNAKDYIFLYCQHICEPVLAEFNQYKF
jgi:late competence protein required for DNA uptake (superfamily II DNA/RNA helicase)